MAPPCLLFLKEGDLKIAFFFENGEAGNSFFSKERMNKSSSWCKRYSFYPPLGARGLTPSLLKRGLGEFK
jgi:hypothetical protein